VNRIDWLLNSDPAIRWQAMRDLARASPQAIAADWLPTLFTMIFLRAAGADRTDPRIADALRVVESRRLADERWLLDRAHDEALAFKFGESVGEPSRWNTLRALRVLRWYESTPRKIPACISGPK
jgi:hypothetical protein